MPTERPDLRDPTPWLPALAALVAPTAVVVFFEARPVWAELAEHFTASDYGAQVYTELLVALGSRFGLLIVVHLLALCVAGASWRLDKPLSTAWAGVGAALLSAVIATRIHLELFVEPTMFGAPLAVAASALLWLGLSATVCAAVLAVTRRRRTRRAAAVFGTGSALVGAVAIYLDHVLFPHDYLALHTALNGVSLAALQAAALCAWALVSTTTTRRRWPGVLAAALFVAFVSVSVAGAALDVDPRVMSRLRSESQLGRLLSAPVPEPACTSPVEPISLPEAREILAREAPLPALPEGFAIDTHDVVFVTIEALRADHAVPHAPELTPRLRALAERGGWLWTQAMAPSTNTLQTMSAILTMTFASMAPVDVSHRDWDGVLRAELPLVPELFAQAGFETVRAADRYRVYHQFARGFEHDIRPDHAQNADADAWMTGRVLETIAAIPAERRVFAWLFLASTHDPYYVGRSDDLTPYARYRLSVAEVDRQLGALVDGLEALGRLENTVLVVMGDHGEEFGEHGSQGHNATLYEELTHVPLLVWLPERAERPGERLEVPMSTTLVWPWLLLSARDEAMAEAAGARLTAELAHALRASSGAAISERLAHHKMPTAVRGERLKLIYDHITGDYELYDLSTDPDEQHDLALDDDVPGRGELEATLERWTALRACTRRYRLRTTRPLVEFIPF